MYQVDIKIDFSKALGTLEESYMLHFTFIYAKLVRDIDNKYFISYKRITLLKMFDTISTFSIFDLFTIHLLLFFSTMLL